MDPLGWLRKRDPGLGALRRAARTAIFMPSLLALGLEVIGNPVIGTFATFGSFAMLLLVDFTGPIADRVRNQAVLAVACAALIALATVVSRSTLAATLTMMLVGFAVLFAGVVSSVLAGATTTLLLSFILSVSLKGTPSAIPDRLAGWGLAAGCSLVAIAVLWPAPARDPVRREAIAACRALAARFRSWPDARAIAESDAAVQRLQDTFYASPFRPTGLSTAARAVVRLVDELRWLTAIVLDASLDRDPDREDPRVSAVYGAAATTLVAAADALEDPRRDPAALDLTEDALRGALAELERSTTTTLPAPGGAVADTDAVVTALSPSFRAQELSFVVLQIAENAAAAAAAERRTWLQRVLGRPPRGFPGTLAAAQERGGAHVDRHSIWLRNSVRGAVGLGLAVLVADLSSVQHGFWVVLGALAVLRSSALSTGQNALRAIVGTSAGLLVGGVLVSLIGTERAVLWALLPVAVLLAGLAPATVSFGAGQAAFTFTLFIVFSILQPEGWRLGLVRIEDVALGCAVSLAVGVLMWPRGAAAALGRALSEAYRDSAAYLAGAVAYGIERCDGHGPPPAEPTAAAVRAAAASRRLDDTFRGYLGERGAKPVPMAAVTSLVTGVTGLRLAADAVLDLWRTDVRTGGDRAAARRELTNGAQRMARWYDDFAESLQDGASVPEPLAADAVADGRLVDAVTHDLRDPEGNATATAVRVVWTGDHLDAARRLQALVAQPARAVVAEHALG